MGETWTFLRRRVGHEEAVGFLDNVEASTRVPVVRVEADVEDSAWAWLRRHDERDYSLVDATSFEVMRRGYRARLAWPLSVRIRAAL